MAEDTQVPAHVGFILDGNRRWAKSQGLPTLEGHRRGYSNLKTIGKAAIKRGVRYVSAFIFSTENWKRTQEEVAYLMDLAYWVATKEVDEIHKDGIRVRFLGSEENVSPKLLQAIRSAEEKTKHNTNGTLALCFNYGGQLEIADAMKRIIEQGIASSDINPDMIAQNLYEPDIPALDLIIRTSGEQRLSNFMLWRAAYSELYFTNKHWPAFSEEDLDEALKEYAKRNRRFGK
jgi:undecaprenyl diphosphate synthase